MFWIVDVLLIAFVGVLLWRGIKLGFTNTSFTLVTAILWIVLGIAVPAVLSLFVFTPLGMMDDFTFAMLGAGEGLYSALSSLGITLSLPDLANGFATADLSPYLIAQYIAYLVTIVTLFIPSYIFFLWVGRKFEQFIRWARTKSKFCKIFGSCLGGLVNGVLAAVIVLGVYWLISALDGSGLFTYTNELLRSAPLSGLIYNNNPLYALTGMDQGSLAQAVGDIISGNFLSK